MVWGWRVPGLHWSLWSSCNCASHQSVQENMFGISGNTKAHRFMCPCDANYHTAKMKPKIRWSVVSRPHLSTQFVEGVRVLWFKGELISRSPSFTHAKTLFDIISTTCFCFDFSASWLFLNLRKGRICAYALHFLIPHRWWLEWWDTCCACAKVDKFGGCSRHIKRTSRTSDLSYVCMANRWQ